MKGGKLEQTVGTSEVSYVGMIQLTRFCLRRCPFLQVALSFLSINVFAEVLRSDGDYAPDTIVYFYPPVISHAVVPATHVISSPYSSPYHLHANHPTGTSQHFTLFSVAHPLTSHHQEARSALPLLFTPADFVSSQKVYENGSVNPNTGPVQFPPLEDARLVNDS